MPANELGFFQKHTEKIALALGLGVLVGAGATQFLLGQPNAVTIDGQQVGPGEIVAKVRTQVDRLQTKLNDSTSVIEAFDAPAYNANFAKLYDRPVADGPLPAVITDGGLEGKLAVIDSPDYPTKALANPPLAINLVMNAGHGVLADAADSREGQQVQALRQIIGDQRPADFPYVSIRGDFPIAEYRERLENAGGTDAERIDKSLWSRRLAVAAVYLMRERQDPSTGAWGEPRIIRPLPGQFGVLPDDRPQLSREEADGLEQKIIEEQDQISREPFPRLANGPWTPPSADNRMFTAEELKQKKDLERDLENMKRRMERLVNPEAANTRRRTNTRTRGGADDVVLEDSGGATAYDDGGAGTARNRRARSSGTGSRAEREQERRLQQQQNLEQQIQEKQTELNNLLGIDEEAAASTGGTGGYDLYGDDSGDTPYGGSGFEDDGSSSAYGGGYGSGARVNPAAGADGPDEIRVWAHDLTCKPGDTYRYKLVVAMFNPLYRQTRLPRKQLKENYDRVSIGPSPSDLDNAPWSPPVQLDPKYFYFATSGNKDEKRAEFEVWTIFNGIWETGSFPEVPGNEIGGVATAAAPGGVPMSVGKILLDVDAVNSPVGGSTQIRTLVLDEASGEIEGRLVSADRRSELRERLESEREQQIQRRDGTGGPTASIEQR